jgi:tetratricopeptide (TPR) repeat protein
VGAAEKGGLQVKGIAPSAIDTCNSAMDAKSQVLAQCGQLNALGLYASAATLVSFMLSPDAQDPNVYTVYGEALFNMGEYKRAEAALRTALDLLGGSPEAPEAVTLRWKISECFGRENNYSMQLYALTAVPVQARTPQINIALGKLHQRFGSNSDAISAYREALIASPLAIEAVEPLAQLGEKEQDILNLVSKKAGNQRWLLTLVAARVQEAMNNHRAASVSYSNLSEAFPDNSELMCNLAVCQAHIGSLQASLQTFAQVRAHDEHYMDQMDEYAEVLRKSGETSLLNKLTSSLLESNLHRPEGWVAGSMYMELKDDRERALEYSEKALQLQPRHYMALLRCGQMHLDAAKYDLALISFRKALDVKRSVRAYEGAVRCYIGMGRIKEALSSAKESLQRMPGNPRALTLVGIALSQLPEGLEKGKVAFEKARQLDPLCCETVIELTNVLVHNNKLSEAVEALETYLRHQDSDYIHSRLGDIYMKLEKLDKALGEYHRALALNPSLESAKAGLESLERLEKTEDAADADTDVGPDDTDHLDAFATPSFHD